jgi:hypothetical protein
VTARADLFTVVADHVEPDVLPDWLPCAGCRKPFRPVHWRQTHCRPSCRVEAFRRRQEAKACGLRGQLVAAGYIPE